MNKLTIIGNLTRDPELRTTTNGVNVCSFVVAVNRRRPSGGFAEGQPQADFFEVTAWRELGELCAKFLAKSRKVCVIGPVEVKTYTGNDGTVRAKLCVTANEIEFLSPKSEAPTEQQQTTEKSQETTGGFTAVETDELPF